MKTLKNAARALTAGRGAATSLVAFPTAPRRNSSFSTPAAVLEGPWRLQRNPRTRAGSTLATTAAMNVALVLGGEWRRASNRLAILQVRTLGRPGFFNSAMPWFSTPGGGARIAPEHLVASCGYLPDFPPLDIEGRLLGDGGLVSNTPVDRAG